MKVKQISVFLENSTGRIASLTKTLKDAGVSLRALSIADTADCGILRIITNDCDKALSVLNNAKFVTKVTDVLAVKIQDEVGSIHDVMELFVNNNINIEYLYASFEKGENSTVIIFKVENLEQGLKVLKDNNYNSDNLF